MARPAKPNVGVIGLGIIGSRVAANLRKAGNQVWVWNRSPRPEPNFLSSPAEVAESAKVIQIFVSDGPALLEVVTAMAPALGPEHIVVNHSTVAPPETIEAARIVEGRHAKYLDAPFTGSRDVAAAGQLVFYIGGASDVLEKVRPMLEVNARAILPIGEIGQAAALKIAMNVIAAVSVSSYAEALSLLHKSGIPLEKLGEVFPTHAAYCPLVDLKVPGMITDDFEPRFSLKHMFKDVQIALAMAADFGVDLPASAAFAGAAMSGLQNGWGDLDFSVVARHYGYPNRENTLPAGLFNNESAGGGVPAPAETKEKKKIFPLFGSK
jgi:3-hydroxyisobutyrate dehydrogenase and related beta-hydroxyacid dehydrogenases